MPLEAGAKLGPYEIIAAIGAGGMGEVYRARDTRLKREVAVKVLPTTTARDSSAVARFQREAEAIAALSHPNILAIHDVGREGEVSFLVCELLEGESLRARLQRGSIPWRIAAELAAAVANGLAAAHAKEIIHRDLKPENIFLTEHGLVKILDFGLARAASADRTDDRTVTLQTKPGTILGTTPYMSPEQVRGSAVDARTDVFAFGCVLFEMLTGKRVFTGETPADVMTAILTQGPPSVSESQTGIPPDLDRIITRCLEKEPASRYDSAASLCRDLKTLQQQAGVSTTNTLGVPLLLPARPSLAILPFENLGGDPEQEYFASGLWVDINSALVKISGLFLISQGSTGHYMGKKASPQQVAQELGVRYVLQGTVRRGGDRVRITTQLMDTQTGGPVWAERYDGQLDDIFAFQDRITEAIVEALDVKLVRGEGQRLLGRSLKCPQARDVFYRALDALFSLKKEDIEEARCLLSDAEQLESDSPLTHIFAAEALYFEVTLGYSDRPEKTLDEAMVLTDRAIEMDDPTGLAHMIQGIIQLRRRQHEAALASSEKSLGNRPSCPWAYALQAAVHNYSGRPAEAVNKARLAMRYTPLVPPVFPAVLATAHYHLGQHDEAVHAAHSTIRVAPDTLEALVILAAALAAARRVREAHSIVKEIHRISATFSLEEFAHSQPYKDPATLDGLLADLRTAGMS